MPAFLKNKKNLYIILGISAIALSLAAAFFLLKDDPKQSTETDQTKTATQSSTVSNDSKEKVDETPTVYWETTGEGTWQPMGDPPACPNPFALKSPTDISKATSVLYPGQTRGSDYKPHGGFRFDNSKAEEITVTSPMDGYVFRGGRYLASGELQYTFDIINSCGYMVRLGHLLTVSPTFQTYADKFPPAAEGDSRTHKLSPYPSVKAGDVIATAVGFTSGEDNTFFDFGVFDLRKQNEASKSTTYQKAHSDEKEQAFFAVCWFDLLPAEDAKKIKSLPAADGVAGKTSDYCK